MLSLSWLFIYLYNPNTFTYFSLIAAYQYFRQILYLPQSNYFDLRGCSLLCCFEKSILTPSGVSVLRTPKKNYFSGSWLSFKSDRHITRSGFSWLTIRKSMVFIMDNWFIFQVPTRALIASAKVKGWNHLLLFSSEYLLHELNWSSWITRNKDIH